MTEPLSVQPIGVIRSPWSRKVDAPRQPRAAEGVEGRIELDPSLAHAVEDLEGFEHVWVLAWMDRAKSARMKVHPPRSDRRRGVFATRAPHRPNPIGLSLVRLERVDGETLHLHGADLIDGTPILDIKPYVPYCDAFPDASAGWIDALGEPAAGPDRLSYWPPPQHLMADDDDSNDNNSNCNFMLDNSDAK